MKIYKGLIELHFDYSENLQKLNRTVLSELSPNLAMIRVPDIFLILLVGTIYWLEGLNKRIIYVYSTRIFENRVSKNINSFYYLAI